MNPNPHPASDTWHSEQRVNSYSSPPCVTCHFTGLCGGNGIVPGGNIGNDYAVFEQVRQTLSLHRALQSLTVLGCSAAVHIRISAVSQLSGCSSCS